MLIHAGMMIFPTLYIWTEFPCVWWGWFYSPSQWMLSVWFGANCHLTLYLYGRGVDSTDYRLWTWSVSPSVSGVTRRAARRSAVTELPARWIAVFLAAAAGPRLGNLCNLRNQTQNIIHSRAAPRRPARLHTPQLKARRGLSCGLQMRLTAGSNDVSDW